MFSWIRYYVVEVCTLLSAILVAYFNNNLEFAVDDRLLILLNLSPIPELLPAGCNVSCCLPLPPKVEGGYVFTSVCLSFCLSVCLSVCLCVGYLKKLWRDSDETWWTGWVCGKDKLFDFGEDPNPDLDTRIIYFLKSFFTVES